MFKGFRDFLLRGNIVDLAVAVIIGGAFGAVVTSFVENVLTPLIGAIGGQPDFSALMIGPVLIGNFLNALIAFLIVALVVYFAVISPMNAIAERNRRVEEEAPPAPSNEEVLLGEIRDLLRRQSHSDQ
jgi:large conductance mechanosensitive channel